MKLRFRQNSLRLRVNRHEVEGLSHGSILKEQVHFPGHAQLSYTLEKAGSSSPHVDFREGTIRVLLPQDDVDNWVKSDEIGLYFELPANGCFVNEAVEKDLECIDGPVEERDPDAYPRLGNNC